MCESQEVSVLSAGSPAHLLDATQWFVYPLPQQCLLLIKQGYQLDQLTRVVVEIYERTGMKCLNRAW